MRETHLRPLRLFVLACCLVAGGSGLLAAPPDLNVPASGQLSAAEVDQLRNRLKYWADQIVKATAAADVAAAGTGARDDYRLSANRDYQYRFAEVADEVLSPLLKGGIPQDDKLLRLKEVNLALTLSRVPQVNVMPALVNMVNHANPAVRYLGWEGFRSVRSQVLAQSPQFARNMLEALAGAAAKEISAPTIGSIFEMADVSSVSSEAIPANTLNNAQQTMFKLLEDHWAQWGQRVLAGDAEMSKAFQKSPAAVKTLSAAQAGGPATKKKALQMLVDLSACAAGAYDFSAGRGPIATENTALLRVCEGALVELSGKNSNHLVVALTGDQTADRGAAVREAVYKWIDDLKDVGVVEPSIAPHATTQPTTREAAAEPAAG